VAPTFPCSQSGRPFSFPEPALGDDGYFLYFSSAAVSCIAIPIVHSSLLLWNGHGENGRIIKENQLLTCLGHTSVVGLPRLDALSFG
jgi:hypothetical protein